MDIANDLQTYFSNFTNLLTFSTVCEVDNICWMKNLVILINWALILSGLYYSFLIMLGFTVEEYKIKGTKPNKRFCILIPAHNEENVIGHTVKSFISHMDYPKEMYDLYVIADNCTDQTAKIAQLNGAKIITHTSMANEPKGKPFGIAYALGELDEKLKTKYDIVVFVDADNLVKSNYLNVMNEEFTLWNYKIVQAYLDVKNPNDNFVSTAYSSAYFNTNRFFEYSKSKLGLSAALGGTGFSIDTNVLREIGWQVNTLTEDLEFQMIALTKGIVPKYTMKTRVYDEKPLKVKQSMVQRTRWSRGHWTVAFRYIPQLFRGLFYNKNKRALLDGIFYLLSPLRAVLSILMIPIVMYYGIKSNDWTPLTLLIGAFIIWIIPSFLISYSIKHDVEQEIKPNIIYIYLSAMFYSLTFIIIHVWGLLTYRKKEWVRTEHQSHADLSKKEEKDE